MAAVPEAPVTELVDLWHLRVPDLEDTLAEEVNCWRADLDWDFHPSADLVRRFVEVHALSGHALMAGRRVVGYAYFVCEDHKGLIGDLFVRRAYRTPETEGALLAAMVDRLMRTRQVRRIETQLMLGRLLDPRALPAPAYARMYRRNFMMAELQDVDALPARKLDRITIDRWTERRQDDTATLIAAAYRGHVDSEINDQYRSPSGARRFLFNIVQYPGCGAFFGRASWAAISRDTGRVCGVSLTSMVTPQTGHITQICVSPSVKGTGVGYELLRRSLISLAEAGARRVSLTVTAANAHAVELYRRVGFEVRRQFPALVWDAF